MAKVRLYGNTSGYVDLQAPDVAGDVTITLPNATGPFALESYVDSAVASAGGLVAVKHALFTGTQTNSTAASANFAVTDLSITHTLADAANKLIISAFIGVAGSGAQRGQVGIAIDDGSGLIAIGDTAGSRVRVSAGGRVSANVTAQVVTMPSITIVHAPGAGEKTYTVRAINIMTNTQTIYINRPEENADDATNSRGVSSLVIQEVKV